jgi:hypothetical protein
MTLTADDVNGILRERAYRPGWTFTAYTGDTTRQVVLQILTTVQDSYQPGRTVPLEIYSPVPTYIEDELAFDKWLAWRLQQAEVHESQEWYRRQVVRVGNSGTGDMVTKWVPVFNPHADGADRDQWPIIKRDR